jgi:hypothetical protein
MPLLFHDHTMEDDQDTESEKINRPPSVTFTFIFILCAL